MAVGFLHDPAEPACTTESNFFIIIIFKVATVHSQAVMAKRSLLDRASSLFLADLPSTLKAFHKIKLEFGSGIPHMINLSGRQLRYLL